MDVRLKRLLCQTTPREDWQQAFDDGVMDEDSSMDTLTCEIASWRSRTLGIFDLLVMILRRFGTGEAFWLRPYCNKASPLTILDKWLTSSSATKFGLLPHIHLLLAIATAFITPAIYLHHYKLISASSSQWARLGTYSSHRSVVFREFGVDPSACIYATTMVYIKADLREIILRNLDSLCNYRLDSLDRITMFKIFNDALASKPLDWMDRFYDNALSPAEAMVKLLNAGPRVVVTWKFGLRTLAEAGCYDLDWILPEETFEGSTYIVRAQDMDGFLNILNDYRVVCSGDSLRNAYERLEPRAATLKRRGSYDAIEKLLRPATMAKRAS